MFGDVGFSLDNVEEDERGSKEYLMFYNIPRGW